MMNKMGMVSKSRSGSMFPGEVMSLKKKFALQLSGLMVIALVTVGLLVHWVILNQSARSDEILARHYQGMVNKQLESSFEHMHSTATDWAYWDDTYFFIQGRNNDFWDANVNQQSLKNIQVDLIAFYDLAGNLLRSAAYDGETGQEIDLSAYASKWMRNNPSLMNQTGQTGGMVSTDAGPMYVVSTPVYHSDLSGPSAGGMIMGRFMDHETLEDLVGSPDLRVSILTLEQVKSNPQMLQAIDAPRPDGNPAVLLEDQYVLGISYLTGLDHKPAFVLQVAYQRNPLEGGTLSQVYIYAGICLIALGAVISVFIFNQRLVFRRVDDITSRLAAIQQSNWSEERLPLDSEGDEITRISTLINQNLDCSKSVYDEYMALIQNQGEGVFILDENSIIKFTNPAAEKIYQADKSSLLGRNIMDFLSEENQVIARRENEIRRRGVISTYELLVEINTGKQALIQITASPRIDRDGKFIGSYIIFKDITEQKANRQILVESETKFRSLVEQATIGVFMTDEQGKIIEWNPRLEAVLLISKQDALEQPFLNIIARITAGNQAAGKFDKALKTAMDQVISGAPCVKTNYQLQTDVKLSDASLRNIELSLFPITTDSGIRLGGIITDITEQIKMKEAENQQKIFIEALRDTSEALNSVLDFDSLMERILINADKVIPSDAGAILLLENGMLRIAQSRGYLEHGKKDIIHNPPFPLNEMKNMKIMSETGRPLAISDTAEYADWNPLPENDWVRSYIGMPLRIRDRVIGFLSLFKANPGFYTQDYAERLAAFASQTATAIENARLYSELQQKANTDELTGLRNRRSFFELGGREVERAIRFGHPLSALMIDLDFFKQVNDTFGHPVGDRLMVVIADQFRRSLRNVDLVARYGGDEFVALLPENGLSSAMEVAHRLKLAIENASIETAQGKARVGVSIGVAELNEHNRNLSSLIENADRALYHAKQYGRSKVVKSLQ
jgi:diguanylate cyclase (GGDEF)-like protein/PAS domain S-box-containing protein